MPLTAAGPAQAGVISAVPPAGVCGAGGPMLFTSRKAPGQIRIRHPQSSAHMMDVQTLLNIFFGLFSGGVGWFAREMWSAVKELKYDLAKLREDLPKEYVAKEDFKDGIREIKDMLNKIFDRLEAKADK